MKPRHILTALAMVFALTASAATMQTVPTTNELVMLNPFSINTNVFAVSDAGTGPDGTATIWTFKAGDVSAASATNLVPILWPTAGRWQKNTGGSGGNNVFNTIYVTNLYATYIISSNTISGNVHGTTNTLAMFTPDEFSVGDSIVTQNSDTNGITVNGTGNAYIVFGPGDTNVLKKSGSYLIYTNGAVSTRFEVVNGNGVQGWLGSDVGLFMGSSTAFSSWGITGQTLYQAAGKLYPGADNATGFGEHYYNLKDIHQRTNYVYAYHDTLNTTNTVRLVESMGGPLAIFDLTAITNNTSAPISGFSFRTNGVEIFSATGTGGPSSGANWFASGTTNSTLAGTAKIGNTWISGSGTNNWKVGISNAIEIGTSANTISGGGTDLAPNLIGSPTKPYYSPYSSSLWDNDTNYIAGSATVATIGGGYDNIVNQEAGLVIGGGHNFIKYDSGGHSVIAGGSDNLIAAGRSGILSGRLNTIWGTNALFSFIGGGYSNTIAGSYSVIPGGVSNSISGDSSFAFGRNAVANSSGVFALTDSTGIEFGSSSPNVFAARYGGGYWFTGGMFGIGKTNAGVKLDVSWTSTTTDEPIARFYESVSDMALDIRARTGTAGIAAKHIDFVGISSSSDMTFSPSTDTRKALVLKDGGNVGIATNAPSEKLEVLGNAKLTGSLLLGTNILSFTGTNLFWNGGQVTVTYP